MSQTAALPMPRVFQLRRKKVPTELSLPNEYVPTDYTTLGDGDDGPSKPKGPNKILLILLGLVLFGAIAAGYWLSQGEDPTAEPQPTPEVTIDSAKASLIVSDGQLNTRISAKTNAPDGTEVTAAMLENDAPFLFWEEEIPMTSVEGGSIAFNIPAMDPSPSADRDATYTVLLTIAGSESVSTTLDVTGPAEELFYAPVAAVETPTAEPTEPVSETITPTEVVPTEVPVPSGPLANIAISRPGIAYQTPYGPAQSVGEVSPGEITTLVAKLSVDSDAGPIDWYLVPVPSTGLSGWISSALIDLPPADVARIPPVRGDSPFAVVYNGGNVRNAPAGAVVITQVNAGENVRVVGRLADNSWFQVEAPSGNGWVAAGLLTINPSIVAGIPVSQ